MTTDLPKDRGDGAKDEEAQVNAVSKAIQEILWNLPDEASRRAVLERVLEKRCRKCLDYDADGSFWCCYDSRGD